MPQASGVWLTQLGAWLLVGTPRLIPGVQHQGSWRGLVEPGVQRDRGKPIVVCFFGGSAG